MWKVVAAMVLACVSLAQAKVLNVEFKFTPFTGDPKADKVQAVPGTARVYLNNVFIAEQSVQGEELPVLFDEREIAAAVWVPVESLGPALRKGKNTIRIEFDPSKAGEYTARLHWAEVTDQVQEEEGPGTYRGTNMAGAGNEDKKATGKVSVEREFTADFAADQPWHRYPAVTDLTDADKERLATLVTERVAWFQPDFAKLYQALDGNPRIEVDKVRASKCLDKAYKAGVRITAPAATDLDFATTGGPEVVVRRKDGEMLYTPDRAAFEKITNEDDQMCAGMTLMAAYPMRMVVVRPPSGDWQVAY